MCLEMCIRISENRGRYRLLVLSIDQFGEFPSLFWSSSVGNRIVRCLIVRQWRLFCHRSSPTSEWRTFEPLSNRFQWWRMKLFHRWKEKIWCGCWSMGNPYWIDCFDRIAKFSRLSSTKKMFTQLLLWMLRWWRSIVRCHLSIDRHR